MLRRRQAGKEPLGVVLLARHVKFLLLSFLVCFYHALGSCGGGRRRRSVLVWWCGSAGLIFWFPLLLHLISFYCVCHYLVFPLYLYYILLWFVWEGRRSGSCEGEAAVSHGVWDSLIFLAFLTVLTSAQCPYRYHHVLYIFCPLLQWFLGGKKLRSHVYFYWFSFSLKKKKYAPLQLLSFYLIRGQILPEVIIPLFTFRIHYVKFTHNTFFSLFIVVVCVSTNDTRCFSCPLVPLVSVPTLIS